MELLLNITTIPIEYEMQTRHARLEIASPTPTHTVTRDPGGLQIKNHAPRLKIDMVDTRASMGWKSVAQVSRESADASLQSALNATAQIARDGNRLADPLTADVPSLVQEKFFTAANRFFDANISFTPAPAAIDWEVGDFSMRYTPDDLSLEWNTVSRPQLEFVPASIEFRIKQRPRLEIQYIGKPLYVPPSADPDYEPKLDKKV